VLLTFKEISMPKVALILKKLTVQHLDNQKERLNQMLTNSDLREQEHLFFQKVSLNNFNTLYLLQYKRYRN